MTAQTVFVTTELAPSMPGGAGRLVADVSGALARRGEAATIILIADRAGVQAPEGVEVVEVTAGPSDPEAPSGYLADSRAAGTAVAELCAAQDADRVEFQDFYGLAWWSLVRRQELGLSSVALTVRMHGPIDLIRESIDAEIPYWDHVAVMETHTYRMADAVIVPSWPMAEVAERRYGVDPDRIQVGEPPIQDLPAVELQPAPRPEIVCLGRLGEVKGSHDLLAACIELWKEGIDLRLRYVGPDGWSYGADTPARQWLEGLVPDRFRGSISFEGPVDRSQISSVISSAWAVAVPSRFETFCLTAHEVRAVGVPLIVRDLPAFRPYFSEAVGALVNDRLADSVRRIVSDPDLRDRLSAAPPPTYGDPLRAYSQPVRVRHVREQGGLATAANEALGVVLEQRSVEQTEGWLARISRWGLRHVPEPAARLAVHVLPQRVKDRFRPVASWPAEQERREHEQRREAVRGRIRSGAFPDLEHPRVSIVIPCFNQGAYLQDALLSVFEQTFSSFEVVVIDDGSDDPETRAILSSLEYPRTRLIRQENRGLPAARNSGMSAARGDLLVPLDADDELAPRFLERLVGALDADQNAGYAHCWARLFGDVDAIWVPAPYNPYRLLLANCVTGCVVLRAEAWSSVGGYAEHMRDGSEDWEFWVRLMGAGWGQVSVRQPLFRYRRHGVSMSIAKEARFEELRLQLRDHNPELYSPAHVRRLKAEWYPWVSVVTGDDADMDLLLSQDLDDVEVIVQNDNMPATSERWPFRHVPGDIGAAVASARGKFLIDWDRVREADPSLLRVLAEALEGQPRSAGATVTTGDGTPLLWRRWSLVDRGGPDGPTIRTRASAIVDAGTLRHGEFPLSGWDPRLDLGDEELPIQQQRPEEMGPIPKWLTTAPRTTR